MKGNCKSSDDCSVLTNYVDDVKGDASGQHDATFWKVLRLYFVSEDPVECLLHLGVKLEGPLEHQNRWRSPYQNEAGAAGASPKRHPTTG